jgi:hypothetical protein
MRIKMQILEERKQQWEDVQEALEDPYAKGIFMYAEKWADKMEKLIDHGYTINKMARETSHEASDEMGGITGYMHSKAAWVLAAFWIHGEELRQWHNLDVDLEQGKQANEDGTILNAAVLTVGISRTSE